MTQWNPVWRIIVDGVTYTNLTLANVNISSGRTNIYSQPVAGYCSLTVINLDNSVFQFQVNQGLTLQLKDSTGTYRTINNEC